MATPTPTPTDWYFVPNFFSGVDSYTLTTSSILPNLILSDYLKWYRIVYSVLFTIISLWVLVKSNGSSITWLIHNTGLISTLAGMWLVTISHFIKLIEDDTLTKHFNAIANNFWLAGMPSYGMFLLAFFLLYEPGAIPENQLNWLVIFHIVMANILLLDNSLNAIVFTINEYSILPIILQMALLIGQFNFYVITGNKFGDQYFFVVAFLYMSYLGLQGLYGLLSNILKKSLRNLYNMIALETSVFNPAEYIKINVDHV